MASALSATAAGCPEAVSGPQTAALIELYTSEGCDSCPPADRWLTAIPAQAGVPVVPVAFHVDYWDYLGWKDRFGRAEYSARQRESARLRGSTAIYTPQVVLSGRDAPIWRSDQAFKSAVEAINRRPARAKIRVMWVSAEQALISAQVDRPAPREVLGLFVAAIESGLVTPVKAGENRGATLHHDFVVRRIERQDFSAGAATKRESLVFPADWKREQLQLVAFVQDLRTGEVLQALAVPICRG